MRRSTLAIHARGPRPNGAVASPINLSTTYEHAPDGALVHGFEYIRDGNPNVDELEAQLAKIEGAAGAVVFSSGMAAASALLQTLKGGSKVIFHRDTYFDIRRLASSVLPQWGLTPYFIDLRDRSALNEALSPDTALVWLESPSNPLLELVDIQQVSSDAAKVGAKTVVDGTFATPALQNPLQLGADYVVHSLTKFISGHSDMQGGAIAARERNGSTERLIQIRKLTGGVLSPFNAWLIGRGLQTLHCRMALHSANALALAEFLRTHDAVSRVRYPYLPGSPDFDLARRQMSAGGGVLSFEVRGGSHNALAVAENVSIFVNATSFGGVESLIEHRSSIEGPNSKAPPGLLRLSVGLEDIQDLREDLSAALTKATAFDQP